MSLSYFHFYVFAKILLIVTGTMICYCCTLFKEPMPSEEKFEEPLFTVREKEWSFKQESFEAEFVSYSTLDYFLARDAGSFQPIRQNWKTDLGGYIKNEGQAAFSVKELWVNDTGPVYDMRSLFEMLGLSGLPDKEKLDRLYRYHLGKRYHGQQRDALCSEPFMLYNAIGTSICSQDATSFRKLAHALGIQCREVGLGGHVISEYRIDNKMRIYDTDFSMTFPLRGFEGLAGVRDIAEDHALGFRVHPVGPWAFEEKKNKKLYWRTLLSSLYGRYRAREFTKKEPREFSMTLLPGEKFTWSFDQPNVGYAISRKEFRKHQVATRNRKTILEEGLYFSSGTLTHDIDFRTDPGSLQWVESRNTRIKPGVGITLDAPAGSSRIEFHHNVSYPMFGGYLECGVDIPSQSSVRCLLKHGSNTYSIITKSGPFEGNIRGNIPRSALDHVFQTPRIIVLLKGHSRNKRPYLKRMHTEFHLHLSPRGLPMVRRGNNKLKIMGTSLGGTPAIKVGLSWREHHADLAPLPPKRAIYPKEDAVVGDSCFTFKWSRGTSRRGRDITHYFIEVNEAPENVKIETLDDNTMILKWDPVDGANNYEIHGDNMKGFMVTDKPIDYAGEYLLNPTFIKSTQSTSCNLLRKGFTDKDLYAHYRIVAINGKYMSEPSYQAHMPLGTPYIIRDKDRCRIKVISSLGNLESRPTDDSPYDMGFYRKKTFDVHVKKVPEGSRRVDIDNLEYDMSTTKEGSFLVEVVDHKGRIDTSVIQWYPGHD